MENSLESIWLYIQIKPELGNDSRFQSMGKQQILIIWQLRNNWQQLEYMQRIHVPIRPEDRTKFYRFDRKAIAVNLLERYFHYIPDRFKIERMRRIHQSSQGFRRGNIIRRWLSENSVWYSKNSNQKILK